MFDDLECNLHAFTCKTYEQLCLKKKNVIVDIDS